MFPFKYLYPRQPDPRRYRASRFRNNVETPREAPFEPHFRLGGIRSPENSARFGLRRNSSLWDRVLIALMVLGLVLAAQKTPLHIRSISGLVLDYISPPGTTPRNPNLALAQSGATVIHSSNAEIPFYGPNMWRLSIPTDDPHVALSPRMKSTCGRAYSVLSPLATSDRYWCFIGTRGQLGIALSHPGLLTNVSIDHPSLSASLANAPRDVVFWGAVDGVENEQRYARSSDMIQRLQSQLHLHSPSPLQEDKELIYVPLAIAFYNIRSTELFQTFEILPEIGALNMDFGLILVQIVSNWGGSFTSLHHIGIYGQAAEGI